MWAVLEKIPALGYDFFRSDHAWRPFTGRKTAHPGSRKSMEVVGGYIGPLISSFKFPTSNYYMKRKIINDWFSVLSIYRMISVRHHSTSLFQRLNRIRSWACRRLFILVRNIRGCFTAWLYALRWAKLSQLRLTGQLINLTKKMPHEHVCLHDIGHGPFSHTLENTIVQGISHEQISLWMMERMNEEMNGRLDWQYGFLPIGTKTFLASACLEPT